MKSKESTKESNPATEAADHTMKNYEQAIRTGMKFQEETWNWWNNFFNPSAFPLDWQKRMATASAATTGMVIAAQKRMEDILGLMEKNTRISSDLMKKAMDATQTPGIAESQAKWMEVWKASLGFARFNADVLLQIQARAADSWISFLQNNEVSKAEKAAREAMA